MSLNNWNIPVVKHSASSEARRTQQQASLTTISETSIFREALQFLLIACKGRQQNLKNDCPHTEISPYRWQHLEDTHHSSWNLIILNAFLKISEPSKGHYSTWECQDEWVIDGMCIGNACIWDGWIKALPSSGKLLFCLFSLVINKVCKTQHDKELYLEGRICGDWFEKSSYSCAVKYLNKQLFSKEYK